MYCVYFVDPGDEMLSCTEWNQAANTVNGILVWGYFT